MMQLLLRLLLSFNLLLPMPLLQRATFFGQNVTASGGGAATVTACGNNYNNFATSIIITTTCTAATGGRLVMIITLGNNEDCTGGTSGVGLVADSSLNTYARDATVVFGLSQCDYSAQVGTQVNSGGTVTVTCAMPGSCEFDGHLYYITPSVNGVDTSVNNGSSNSCGGGTGITVTGSAGVSATDIVLVSGEVNNGAANPYSGNWSGAFTTLLKNNTLGGGNQAMAYGWAAVASGTPTSTIPVTVGGGNCTVGTIVAYKQ